MSPVRKQPDGAGGVWTIPLPASRRVQAAVGDRRLPLPEAVAQLRRRVPAVEAEQVHGAAIAVIERLQSDQGTVPGCDALLTALPNVALVIRSADCLPIFFSDPVRGVVAIVHAGWRGLAARLPMRVVALMLQRYHGRARDLEAAIGPCIRGCCYEVGSEFEQLFGPFVRREQGRLFCDLPAAALAQLAQAGLRPERIHDSGQCTGCRTDRWFSLRKEGPSTGRLASWIQLR